MRWEGWSGPRHHRWVLKVLVQHTNRSVMQRSYWITEAKIVLSFSSMTIMRKCGELNLQDCIPILETNHLEL